MFRFGSVAAFMGLLSIPAMAQESVTEAVQAAVKEAKWVRGTDSIDAMIKFIANPSTDERKANKPEQSQERARKSLRSIASSAHEAAVEPEKLTQEDRIASLELRIEELEKLIKASKSEAEPAGAPQGLRGLYRSSSVTPPVGYRTEAAGWPRLKLEGKTYFVIPVDNMPIGSYQKQ